jgi:hypothetical protein
MKRPKCRQENEECASFCEECAAPIGRACAKCGRPLSPTAKFRPGCAHPVSQSLATTARLGSPESYPSKHLAEKILTSKTAVEGERRHITVLFADLKWSMKLLADRDPEEARKLLGADVERMIKDVHHYEGMVNEVRGDGITALFGAPLAHEDHALRACFAALRMQEEVKRYADEVRRSDGDPGSRTQSDTRYWRRSCAGDRVRSPTSEHPHRSLSVSFRIGSGVWLNYAFDIQRRTP